MRKSAANSSPRPLVTWTVIAGWLVAAEQTALEPTDQAAAWVKPHQHQWQHQLKELTSWQAAVMAKRSTSGDQILEVA